VCQVEDNIQLMLQEVLSLPLGIRLHRHVAMGEKRDDPATPFFWVFLTIFDEAVPLTWMDNKIMTMKIKGHEVQVNH
jgi:hypothetical protein